MNRDGSGRGARSRNQRDDRDRELAHRRQGDGTGGHRGFGMGMEWSMTGAVRTERGGFTVVTGRDGAVYIAVSKYIHVFVFL